MHVHRELVTPTAGLCERNCREGKPVGPLPRRAAGYGGYQPYLYYGIVSPMYITTFRDETAAKDVTVLSKASAMF